MKTTSESAFETFLSENNLAFQKVEERDSPRPDYLVQIGELEVFFEVKELAEDEDFKTGSLQVSSRIIGDHIRQRIHQARKQVQFGAGQSTPSAKSCHQLSLAFARDQIPDFALIRVSA